ncbi:hypothetical protein PHSC3_000217 [Chlamydiales bacterium STE3]|nr:hypothetical protein PHSC3_000217 [Chlamydiales bacterium STE3]
MKALPFKSSAPKQHKKPSPGSSHHQNAHKIFTWRFINLGAIKNVFKSHLGMQKPQIKEIHFLISSANSFPAIQKVIQNLKPYPF